MRQASAPTAQASSEMANFEDETVEVYGTDFRAKGFSHTLIVCRNDKDNGWIVYINIPGFTELAANLCDEHALVLASLLITGSGPDFAGKF